MSVRVELGDRSYEVRIGPSALTHLGAIVRAVLPRPARNAFVAVDSGVPHQFAEAAKASLTTAGLHFVGASVPGGESCKSLGFLENLLNQMTAARLERTDLVVSIGGGAVCDLVGFAASVYRRGVPVIHCPTTLLAMVDASVGGKTGINLPLGGSLKKNMVGAFWQPAAVFADVNVLRTLPLRELRAGLAECIKHALIGGQAGEPDLLQWTEEHLSQALQYDDTALTQLVERNVAIKAAIVAGDEREVARDAEGGRALLNLGHTFGHVVETLHGTSAEGAPAPLLHGECVAIGLVAASVTGQAMGLAPQGLPDRVRNILQRAGLPTAVRGLPASDQLINAMLDDKKSLGGVLRLVLPTNGAHAVVISNPDLQAVALGWDSIRAK